MSRTSIRRAPPTDTKEAAEPSDALARYRSKRNFAKTPEPAGGAVTGGNTLAFVVQKHAATRLHYDLRLELDGVLLSWAVPRGPSYDPSQKRMAVRTEDHPLAYATFEGMIPAKEYGAGTMIVWDRGTWEPMADARQGLATGKLEFRLHGQKLAGLWELVRIQKPSDKQETWLLFKKRDEWARSSADYDVVSALPDSVIAKPLGPVEQRQPGKTQAGDANDDHAVAALANAPVATLPAKFSPQLATLATAAPTHGDWTYEIKFDGYRILSRIDQDRVKFLTRNGNDWTAKMESLAQDMKQLGIRSAWLDCEAIVMDADGVPSFNALQNAFDGAATDSIVLYVFDIPFLDGKDLRGLPLGIRRAILKSRMVDGGSDRIRFSDTFGADGPSVLASACKMGLEGVIAKRLDARYESRRTETWLKLKCHHRQEFVIGGFTDRAGGVHEVGSLLLGVYDDDGKLRSAGSVGTGWSAAESASMWTKLSELETDASPFDAAFAPSKGRWSRRPSGSERWVKPTLVAEVSFAEWTPEGSVRHGSFEGLRRDKVARSIRRETATLAVAPASQVRKPSAKPTSSIKVSNPQRVIDASTGLTKLDLVRYYESVADWILPHLKGRPTSLVRGPDGIAGELFFQKHGERIGIPGLRELDPSLWPGHKGLLEIPSAEALVGAAQLNVIEFHTWNSTVENIDKPDRMIFDLDPGEGVDWKQIQEAAMLTRVLLTELGLDAWLKTSGGKGLHVVVPTAPRMEYEVVSEFSRAIVVHLARTIPSRFVAKSGGGNRVGKIFVDYLRNGHGATTAAAFSARSRPGLGVSMPVHWEQLDELTGGAQWTIATAREYLSFQKDDPWKAYWKNRQTLSRAMKRLDFDAGRRKGTR